MISQMRFVNLIFYNNKKDSSFHLHTSLGQVKDYSAQSVCDRCIYLSVVNINQQYTGNLWSMLFEQVIIDKLEFV